MRRHRDEEVEGLELVQVDFSMANSIVPSSVAAERPSGRITKTGDSRKPIEEVDPTGLHFLQSDSRQARLHLDHLGLAKGTYLPNGDTSCSDSAFLDHIRIHPRIIIVCWASIAIGHVAVMMRVQSECTSV